MTHYYVINSELLGMKRKDCVDKLDSHFKLFRGNFLEDFRGLYKNVDCSPELDLTGGQPIEEQIPEIARSAMQSFIAYLHELPDEIRNEMFMRRFLGRMDSRMEMRGHGLDMSQWASRSSTPEEITIQKNADPGTACDELYWWLHYYKLQNLYRYLKGTKLPNSAL